MKNKFLLMYFSKTKNKQRKLNDVQNDIKNENINIFCHEYQDSGRIF